MRVCHVVQTRFSIRAAWGFQDFPREWLEERLGLFDTYCLPSIANQTCRQFEWHVYCDRETDPEILMELRFRAAEVPQMKVALTGPGEDNAATHVRKAVAPDARAVMTTRLDSDDALCTRYVATAQSHAERFVESDRATWLLNFPRGFQLDADSGQLLFDWMPRSNFHTLFERPEGEPKTVLSGNHASFHETHPTDHDDSLAAWLMVIHGGNVKNSLRDYYTGEADRSRLTEFGLT